MNSLGILLLCALMAVMLMTMVVHFPFPVIKKVKALNISQKKGTININMIAVHHTVNESPLPLKARLILTNGMCCPVLLVLHALIYML